MNRAAGSVAVAVGAVWIVAHLLYIGPVQDAAETTLLWVLGFGAACLVVAAIVLLGVGLTLSESRPAWLRFVRLARTTGAFVGSALVLIGLLRYRDTAPRSELHWLVLGVAVLAGTLIVHWWVMRVVRRAAA
jgi:hypothetical protein